MTTLNYSSGETLELGDKSYEVDFDAIVEVSYAPARVSGPPEDCHPDESEISVTSINITAVYDDEGEEVVRPSSAFLAALTSALQDSFQYHEECIWEQFHDERGNGFYED